VSRVRLKTFFTYLHGNLAAEMLALKLNLQPKEVILLIEKGSDTLPENPKLRLINPQKT
jgi:hypothetical protein